MGFFGDAWNWVKGAAKKVGGWVNKNIIQPVGNFVRKIDFSKVGAIAGKVADVAGSVAGMGIPIISTIAKGVNVAGKAISRFAPMAGKAKDAIIGVQDAANVMTAGGAGSGAKGLGMMAQVAGGAIGGKHGGRLAKAGDYLGKAGTLQGKYFG